MKTSDIEIRYQPARRWAFNAGAFLAGVFWLAASQRLQSQPSIPPDQLPNQTNCQGSCLTYTVTATGDGPFTYEWRIYTNLTGYRVWETGTSDTVVLCDLQPSDNRLRVLVTDTNGLFALSPRYARMVIIAPLVITQQAIGGSAVIGQSFTQYVTVTGTAPAYQWYFNEQPLAGKTASSLAIASVQTTNAGDYHVVISNACGVVTSETGPLTLSQATSFTRISTGPVVTEVDFHWGCAWVDYNNDGYQDLFVTAGGNETSLNFRNRLYRNNGNGTFTAATAGEAGRIVSDLQSYYGCSWGDYDNDGFMDVFVSDSIGTNALYRNNGTGGFERIANAGAIVTSPAFSQSAPWVDYDNDGLLDLFMASGYYENNQQWPITLYHGEGSGQFTKASDSVLGNTNWGGVQVCAWGDYDNDGDADVVLSDIGTGRRRINLFQNQGHGAFAQVFPAAMEPVDFGLPPSWVDYDNDGRLDLFWGGWFSPSRLFRNGGSGQWTSTDIATASGGGNGAWGDYDNDGHQDLFACGGQGQTFRNQVFRNNGNGTFTEILNIAPATTSGRWSTAAWGDYDNDGFLDLVVVSITSSTNVLYHNEGNSNHWIKIHLRGTVANRAALGAKVRVQATVSGRPQWQLRELSGGNRAQDDLRAHFGLGDATRVETLRVEWPSGQVTELHNVPADEILTITEAPGLRAIGLSQGAMQMQLTAHPGMNIELRVTNDLSSDFTNWPLWQTVLQTNRTMTVTDPEAGQHLWRFYGARVK